MSAVRIRSYLLAVGLVVATLFAFWPILSNGFINYDDPIYVTDNTLVQSGLSMDGIRWAFTTRRTGNWHPVTWLSHLLDYELHGLEAGRHHLTSLLLHLLSSLVLFALLRQLTGSIWPSAFVALVFAVHPLRVESVAWVAERKDVLCTLFWMLSLRAYVGYTKNPGLPRYLLLTLLFALGLMAKPTLVTLPFVLLLLDYWPLQRFKARPLYAPPWRLVREKIPLFVVSAVFTAVAYVVQQQEGAVGTMAEFSLGQRVGNALVAYVAYIGKFAWPSHLAVFYPHPEGHLSPGAVLRALLLLGGVTFAVLRSARTQRYWATGWFWYLGTMIPVIGLVQLGGHAMADRYTYVPHIGLSICLAWGAAELTKRKRVAPTVWGGLAVAVLLGLTATTRLQTYHWRDSISVFQHAIEVTERNHLAHNQLGVALAENDRRDEAIRSYEMALSIRPGYASAQHNLAAALEDLGETDEVIRRYKAAIHSDPDRADPHYNLARVLAKQGRIPEAITHYRDALELRPDFAQAHNNLARLLDEQGRAEEALEHFFAASQAKPNDAVIQANLGNALHRVGRTDEAISQLERAITLAPDHFNAHYLLGIILSKRELYDNASAHYRRALDLKPSHLEARYYLAIALTLTGKRAEAVRHYQEVVKLQPQHADAHYNLGVVLAQQGRMDEASRHYEVAVHLDPRYASAPLIERTH